MAHIGWRIADFCCGLIPCRPTRCCSMLTGMRSGLRRRAGSRDLRQYAPGGGSLSAAGKSGRSPATLGCPGPSESPQAGWPDRPSRPTASCRAHRTQDPAQRSLADVRADADHHLANHNLHYGSGRAHRGVWYNFFRKTFRQPNSCGGRNPQAPRQRGNVHARLERCRDARLELIRPRAALPDRCSVKTLNHSLDQLQLPVAGIGVELVVDMEPRRQTNANSLSQTSRAANPIHQMPGLNT